MLEPRSRRLLLESLRPPEGYALDRALGTTYSLDLLALLTAPLAFTLFDAGDASGRGEAAVDPLAILTALRRHAEQITLFCQAGQIAVPARHQLLYSHLEGSVFEAVAPDRHRAFHPKVWLLRFADPEGSACYRLLCLSRNLTFNRSWDTLLVLDGEMRDRTKAFAINHPLGDFIAALPGLAIRPLPEAARATVELMQEEVRRVRFEPPEGFELKGFWPLGIPGAPGWPFHGRMDRLLVVSPFISPNCLKRLTAGCKSNVLVSRLESLTALPAADLDRFERVYQLSPLADAETSEGEAEGQGAEEVLAGLHAKLYLADAGWQARLWTGSANATEAAFGGNVEFLVELEGRKSQCGIDAVLRPVEAKRPTESFLGLLQVFCPGPQVPPIDAEQQRLEQEADEIRGTLAGAGLRAVLSPRDEPDSFRLALVLPTGGRLDLRPGAEVVCWPINLPEAGACPLVSGAEVVAEFKRLSGESVTAFFAFAVTVRSGRRQAALRFVLNLPLEGAPADRRERLLRALLKDRAQVLRLLRFLLAEEGTDAMGLLVDGATGSVGATGPGGPEREAPLLETLIRSLDRSPAKLDEVARLVEELSKTAEGLALLPEDFLTIWNPIHEAHRRRHP